LGDKVKKNEMGGACSTHGRGEKYIKDLVGKPVGKRPLGRPGRRREIILQWIFGKQGESLWMDAYGYG
jgi:hypothetical protein